MQHAQVCFCCRNDFLQRDRHLPSIAKVSIQRSGVDVIYDYVDLEKDRCNIVLLDERFQLQTPRFRNVHGTERLYMHIL